MGKRRKKNSINLIGFLIVLLMPAAFFSNIFGETTEKPEANKTEILNKIDSEELTQPSERVEKDSETSYDLETGTFKKKEDDISNAIDESAGDVSRDLTASDIPSYAGPDSTVINGGKSTFTTSELTFTENKGWVEYGDLDGLNRVTTMNAIVTPDMYDTGTEANGNILPTGWNKQNQDSGNPKQLNRGHLLGNVLGGSGDDLRNLITLYRNANYPEMYFGAEEIVKNAIENGSVVRYRVTPIFEGDALMAKGIHLMAKSISDDSVDLNIFVYNQPKDEID